MQRQIPLEGVDNFRDFGGYPTRFGRPMKRGRFFRSASHARATDADLEAIAAFGIATVVDLRRWQERERDPSRRHPAFAGVVIMNDDEAPDSWQEHIRKGDITAEGFRAYLHDYYRNAPFEPRHVDLFRRYFQAVGETDTPILIHCAAGKDRTGILAALTHHLAGVSRDDAIADYLLTNDPERFERRIPAMMEVIAEQTGHHAPPEALMVALGVEAGFLATAYQEIEAACGSLDAYLETTIGLDAAARAALTERLLEPAA